MTTSAIAYPALWFTSGSPINTGQRDCAYRRWLAYHAGAHGTGYRKRSTAIPLATGSGVHRGLELIGGWILDWQAAHAGQRLLAVPDEVIAWGAAEAARGYEASARARGLELTRTDATSAEALERIIREQATLIEAQVWVYAIVRLPFMLATHRLVEVEQEESPVLACTCGLGDWFGTWETHDARGCTGIVAQDRCDFLWEVMDQTSGQIGNLVYEQFKTKATPNYGSEMAWEHSGQLLLGMEAASRRLGRDVTTAYVPTLYKGRREKANRDDLNSPKIQMSPLVYGWFDPGNGLGRPADWSARYRWTDDWGKGHTLPRTYTRTPIWEASAGDLRAATNPNGITIRPEASIVEAWVRGWVTPAQYVELLKVLGPYPRPVARVPDAIDAILAEETRWRTDVDYLRSYGIHEPSDVVTDANGIAASAQTVIARSWNCTGFDGTPCSFKPICHKDPGWERLDTHGLYEIRTPHHEPEKTACERGGLVFPEQDEDEGGEE